MSKPVSFSLVLPQLESLRDAAVTRLRTGSAGDVLELKQQLEAAIAVLRVCERFQFDARDRITTLPPLRTSSPSCAYRIAEDQETDDRAQWVELTINDRRIELSPGDLLVERSRYVPSVEES